jgi:cell division protein FtsQ
MRREKAPRAPKPARTERGADTVVPLSPKRAARLEVRQHRRIERMEARRFTRSSRRRRVAWLSALGVVVVLGGVLAIAIFSPLLALRTISVDGTKKVSASDIRSAVSGQLGTPLALLDQGKIRKDLERFTLIRSYVTQVVPPNTLVIRIVERQPIAVVASGSGFDQVDAAGVVLATTTNRGSFPVIDVGNLSPTSGAFRSAVQVLLALPKSLSGRVRMVSATTADDLRITLAGSNRVVVWGSASGSGQKVVSLSLMLKQASCSGQAIIDVSAPSAPICGPEHSSG